MMLSSAWHQISIGRTVSNERNIKEELSTLGKVVPHRKNAYYAY